MVRRLDMPVVYVTIAVVAVAVVAVVVAAVVAVVVIAGIAVVVPSCARRGKEATTRALEVSGLADFKP